FYALAHDLGIDALSAALEGFGFGGPTGIDIGGESAGIVPSPAWKRGAMGQPWYPGETLILGIGQGFMLTTPMQLATATMALANHGHVLMPHVLAEARDPVTGQIVTRTRSSQRREVAARDRAYWQAVVDSMNAVVQGPTGTARRSGAKAGYRFAGKTGTAQVFGIAQDAKYDSDDIPEELRDHALFIAFAPLEDPRIALAIIVENGGGGSSTAAPIARMLLDYYLDAPEPGQRVATAAAAAAQ